MLIYLDNAATTLHKPPEVSAAVSKAMKTCGSTGRGGHAASMAAADALFDLREAATELFSMSEPNRVIITSSATHSLNLAINSLVKPGANVLVSGYEHNAVMRPLKAIEGYGVSTIPVATSLFDEDAAYEGFKRAIENTRDISLVICIHVSNVFGFKLPVERIAELCKERQIPMLVDASQSAGLLPLNGDLYPYWCMPGHKSLYGPQGTGLILIPPGGTLDPLLLGGTGGDSRAAHMPEYLPDKLEAGTHNTPGAAGLTAGIKFVLKDIKSQAEDLTKQTALELTKIQGVCVYYGQSHVGPLSFTLESKDSETVAAFLAEKDIAVRAGLHCAPSAHQTVGTYELGTVRVSYSHANKASDMEKLLRAVKEIAEN